MSLVEKCSYPAGKERSKDGLCVSSWTQGCQGLLIATQRCWSPPPNLLKFFQSRHFRAFFHTRENAIENALREDKSHSDPNPLAHGPSCPMIPRSIRPLLYMI